MIRRILFLFCFFFLMPAPVQAAPKMVFQKHKVVLEKPVLQGETVEGEFVVTNEGDEGLVIKDVAPG